MSCCSPENLEFIGCSPAPDGQDFDACKLIKRIHFNALVKLGEVEVSCEDMYKIGGRESTKPAVVEMLKSLIAWSATMYQHSCDGPYIGSARPSQSDTTMPTLEFDAEVY